MRRKSTFFGILAIVYSATFICSVGLLCVTAIFHCVPVDDVGIGEAIFPLTVVSLYVLIGGAVVTGIFLYFKFALSKFSWVKAIWFQIPLGIVCGVVPIFFWDIASGAFWNGYEYINASYLPFAIAGAVVGFIGARNNAE